MLAAALLELVPDRAASLRRLRALDLPGISFEAKAAERGGVAGTLLDVRIDGALEGPEPSSHSDGGPHDHHHHDDHHHDDHHHDEDHHDDHHHHVSLAEIKERIASLPVSEKVRADAVAVYDLLAEAEAKAHGAPMDHIHFHEIGSLDAMADVASVSLLLEELAPDRILASPPNAGGGTVRCAHGELPVPAPATANLLLGMPWHGDAPETGELLTPTGAALLRHFVSAFGPFPSLTVERIGVGLGHRETPGRANLVRAFLGRSGGPDAAGGPNGRVAQLCANIDDMTGEALAFACDRIRAAGALDVSLVPMFMKKGRPGHLLLVVARPEEADALAAAMLRETTSLGVRRIDCSRYELRRSLGPVPHDCGGHPVRMKRASGFGVGKTKPEFDDLAAAAAALDVPISALRLQPPAAPPRP